MQTLIDEIRHDKQQSLIKSIKRLTKELQQYKPNSLDYQQIQTRLNKLNRKLNHA